MTIEAEIKRYRNLSNNERCCQKEECMILANWLEELLKYRKAEEQGLLVEVIRCKDCKHFCGGGLWDNGHWCGRTARPGECDRVTENDFCSKAESALAEKGGA